MNTGDAQLSVGENLGKSNATQSLSSKDWAA